MSASAFSLQNFIHALEQGRLRLVVWWAVILAATVALALAYLGLLPLLPWAFRGFARAEAIDQAQVSREFARGNGFSTKCLRPLEIALLERHRGAPPRAGERTPELFHAPLGPVVNSMLMRRLGDKATFNQGEFLHPAERAVAGLAMLCFAGAVGLNYLTLRRIFDDKLALLASGLILISDGFWQWTLTGLPQMLMLLLFSGALLVLTRAISARLAGAPGRALGWLALAGLLLGLITLAHGLGCWLFAGALVAVTLQFRPRPLAALALAVPFALVVLPWLARNYSLTGNPLGLAGYAILEGVNGTTPIRMRGLDPLTAGVSPLFLRPKLMAGIVSQLGSGLGRTTGGGFLALGFFLALLYPFRRPEAAALRWTVAAMWAAAVFGMALLGWEDNDALAPGNLHVLFVPLMMAYGLAMALVLFGRLPAAGVPLWRLGFLVGIYALTALPMVASLTTRQPSLVQYPPYFPAAIARLNAWTDPNEITGSDIPWAVAWYADRPSLWIPNKQKDFLGLNDAGKLPGTLAGLFLTPQSRNAPLLSSIIKGEYAEWAPLIFGNLAGVKDFPFKAGTPVGDPGMTFYSDRARWTEGGR